MAIARLPVFVFDCPEPRVLAEFYAAVLDWQVDVDDAGDWAEIFAEGDRRICFQQVGDYHAPAWPGQEHPQQLHLDVDVDDLDAGQAAVMELGARKHEVQPSEGENDSFRVFLDPAGHPFCLCQASEPVNVG